MDVDLGTGVDAGVLQGLDEGLVGLGKVHVLADEGDFDAVLGVLQGIHQAVPHGKVGGLGQDVQLVADDLVQHLVVQHGRDLVDGIGVQHLDHGFALDVAEQGDLALFVFRDFPVGAAQQHVGLDANFPQFLDGMLGRLGLQLAGGGNVGQQGQVQETGVVAAFLEAHLADGFQERQGLDVTHGAAHLDDGHVGPFGATLDVGLDLVGDVGDDLHRLAQVLAATLFLEHRVVDLAGGEVVALAHLGAGEALVVAQVQVGLGAVFGDEHLAVLEGAHGARVDVDVGIKLEVGDGDSAGFENRTQRGSGNSLTQGRNHAASDEDVFGHDDIAAGKPNCSR